MNQRWVFENCPRIQELLKNKQESPAVVREDMLQPIQF